MQHEAEAAVEVEGIHNMTIISMLKMSDAKTASLTSKFRCGAALIC
jgi:hypothetical protein